MAWLQVVKVRSRSMAAAAAMGRPHGMLSVVGLPDSDLNRICGEVLDGMPNGTVCCIANHLFPNVSATVGHLSVFLYQAVGAEEG